jgi:hypothetical protein
MVLGLEEVVTFPTTKRTEFGEFLLLIHYTARFDLSFKPVGCLL